MLVNNFSGNGDTINLGGSTTGQGVNTYAVGYGIPLGYDGIKAEIRHFHADYSVGKELSFLGARGRADATGAAVSYPFLRGAGASFYGALGYDVKHMHDDTDSAWS